MDQLTRRGNTEKDPLPLFDNQHHQEQQRRSTLTPKKNGSAKWLSRIRIRQLVLYLLIWFGLLYYFERVQVKRIISRCRSTKIEGSTTTTVSLIADPQLVDDYSYPGRPNFINHFAKRFSDNYLHRNYMLHKQILQPDYILFLGDLFDGGREWSDAYWYDEYTRFNKVFPKFTDVRTVMSLPGNHDIGFGNDVNITKLNRFRTYFGESNDYMIINGFAIVMLDTISLSSNDTLVNSEPFEFLQKLSQPDHEIKKYPTILLTHVPLYRFSDRQECGPLRESQKKFPVMKGKQYQTVLEYPLSQELLQSIQPVLIFSGDDHDYCEVNHSYINGGENKIAKEITIKSVAMSAGIRYPAIQTLSLSSTDNSYATNICFMPTPFNTLRLYILTLVWQILSFVLVLAFPNRARSLESKWKSLFQNYTRILPVDSKDDDHDDEKLKYSNIKLIHYAKDVLRSTDWQIPETRSKVDSTLNVIILIVLVWFLMVSFFNNV